MNSRRVSDLLPDRSKVTVIAREYSKEQYEALKEFLQTMHEITIPQWPPHKPIVPWTSTSAVNFSWQLHIPDKKP